jgi:acetylornithine deacetylase/succinyl-diaminopimelate desuccinylase-like protein
VHPLLAAVDWRREGAVTLSLLQRLLRFDTTNPPGDEEDCAVFVAERLRACGLEPSLMRPAPRRANVLARLRGGHEPPLLLSAHLDVVPAEAGQWTHPPFGGEIHDGFVWGRGAIDMKHMAAMSLVVVDLLARSGAPLRRDVILAGVADEEVGCGLGSAWLVDHHPEAVRAGFALNEVGGFTTYIGGRPVYPVEIAEKGTCLLRARARGPTGHGSMPRGDSAVLALSSFLARLRYRRLPVHRSAALELFVRDLVATQPLTVRVVLPLLLHPRWSRLVTGALVRDRSSARLFEALVRNTVTPTILRGGFRANVLPSVAEATLDGRVAVGSSADELVAEVRRLAGRRVELEVLGTRAPYEAPGDTALLGVIRDVVAEHHPGAATVASVIPGSTDAYYYGRLGTTCYGFAPVRLEPCQVNFLELFHAHDERIPVDGLTAGLRMLADVVFRFCVSA